MLPIFKEDYIQVIERIRGRRDMNASIAAKTSSVEVTLECKARVAAYETAMLDMEMALKGWEARDDQ